MMVVGSNLALGGAVESTMFAGSLAAGAGAVGSGSKAVKVMRKNDHHHHVQWRACSQNVWPASSSLLEQITGPTPPQWQSSSSSPSSSSSSGPVLRKVEQEKTTESSLQSVNGSRPPEVSTKDLVSLQLPSKPPAYGFFSSSSSSSCAGDSFGSWFFNPSHLGISRVNFFKKWVTWVGGKTVECGSLAKVLSYYSSVSEKIEQLGT
jgi:hypothetical protein